jgi:hypothetical protein
MAAVHRSLVIIIKLPIQVTASTQPGGERVQLHLLSKLHRPAMLDAREDNICHLPFTYSLCMSDEPHDPCIHRLSCGWTPVPDV